MLIQDIATYITSKGQANGIYNTTTNPTGNIQLEFMPDTPDNLIVIAEYPGISGVDVDSRRVAIQVRGTKITATIEKINSIYKLFALGDEERQIMLTFTRWANVKALGTPAKISMDEKERWTYGFNLAVLTERDT